MTPQNTIILRPVFNTLPIAQIAHFGTLGATKSCFSLKRGAILAISRFFTLLSKMRDFGLTNHLDLRHLDPPTRSQNPVENQAYFWCHFRSILASIWCPRECFCYAFLESKCGSWPQGAPKWSFLVIKDLLGAPKWSFWVILDLWFDHFAGWSIVDLFAQCVYFLRSLRKSSVDGIVV